MSSYVNTHRLATLTPMVDGISVQRVSNLDVSNSALATSRSMPDLRLRPCFDRTARLPRIMQTKPSRSQQNQQSVAASRWVIQTSATTPGSIASANEPRLEVLEISKPVYLLLKSTIDGISRLRTIFGQSFGLVSRQIKARDRLQQLFKRKPSSRTGDFLNTVGLILQSVKVFN